MDKDLSPTVPADRHRNPMQPAAADGLTPAYHCQHPVLLVNVLNHLVHEPHNRRPL